MTSKYRLIKQTFKEPLGPHLLAHNYLSTILNIYYSVHCFQIPRILKRKQKPYLKAALSQRYYCMSKLLKCLIKLNLFSNMKMFLEHRDENMKMVSPRKNKLSSFVSNLPKIHRRNLTKLANSFKLQSIFHLSHPQSEINDTSFCALIRGRVINKTGH